MGAGSLLVLGGMAETSRKEDENYDTETEESTWDLQGMPAGMIQSTCLIFSLVPVSETHFFKKKTMPHMTFSP